MEPDTASAIERRLTELEQEVARLSTLADAAAHAAAERAAAFGIESADAGANPDAASAGPGGPPAAGSDAPADKRHESPELPAVLKLSFRNDVRGSAKLLLRPCDDDATFNEQVVCERSVCTDTNRRRRARS